MFGFVVRTTGLEPVLSQRSRFSYHLDFRRRLMTFVVWTVPSPLPEGFRRRPSSLYTFPEGAWLGIGLGYCPLAFPTLSGSTPRISRGHSNFKVCCVYRFRHVRLFSPFLALVRCTYVAPSAESFFVILKNHVS
uniref:Uncharacterized protein n=1 Tax=Salmonella enterica subsp. enterica serovar London TaxID=149390 RepID=A0A3G8EVN4_SALET|nr:hypothetical protein KADIGFNM_00199 [Salmonella enterica subsp. enterica serovar London]AZF85703.1 hypothetical protein KADIGFNM_00366 [Salmonella enterica subsp. enterica serovar London]